MSDPQAPTAPVPAPATPPAPSAPGVGARSAAGFVWMLAQTLGARLFSAVGQVFLARLLTPQDFGLVGLANTLFTLALVVVNPGIEDILVSRSRHFHRWANAAFWMSLACGIVGALGMVLLAPLGAWMYDAPRLPVLVGVLALNAWLTGILTVPQARLRSQLQFRVLAVSGVVTAFFHVVLAVSLAWAGLGAVAFVLPLPLMTAVRLIWLWRATRPVIFPQLQLRRWHRLLPDTAALFGGGRWVPASARETISYWGSSPIRWRWGSIILRSTCPARWCRSSPTICRMCSCPLSRP